MTKTELLAALRSSADDAVLALRALPESAFDAGRYENGWNAKQILAHIASIEWTYPRLLDLGKQSASTEQPAPPSPAKGANATTAVRRTTPEEAAGMPTRLAAGGIDSYNDRQVQKRADASVPDLIAEFEKNRTATIAAIASADDDLFARPIRSAGGITGALADVIRAVAVDHVRGHVADITGAKHEGARW
ncbi:MAG: maleylpyruvate isomerase N-terminal domain-containing protein [Chloroflexota bacterium]|nr:maleylpyruvate isomerase N-terminal domain-containing protein [Chloroflexota bacterium]